MPAPKGHPPYNKKGEGGRPKIWTADLIEKEADAFEEWMSRPESLWYEDFALERGYLPDYFGRWSKENERFSTVYKKSQIWQKSKLVNGGLLSKYNAGFTKFVMGNTCGWRDKVEAVSSQKSEAVEFALAKMEEHSGQNPPEPKAD